MIDLAKYNFNDEDLEFISDIKADIENQNEIDLIYKDYRFCIEPSGDELTIVDIEGDKGTYFGFDDLFENFKIDDVSLIELVHDLDFD